MEDVEKKRERKRRYMAQPRILARRRKEFSRPDSNRRNKMRGYNLKRRHGISEAEFEKRLEAQEYKCPICGRDLREDRPCLDHCHETGKRRAVLCHRCNKALGLFQDSPAMLIKAAEYLRSHGKD